MAGRYLSMIPTEQVQIMLLTDIQTAQLTAVRKPSLDSHPIRQNLRQGLPSSAVRYYVSQTFLQAQPIRSLRSMLMAKL